MRIIVILFFLLSSFLYPQDINQINYLNPELPIEQRVIDLVSRMTLEEKTSQMVNDAIEINRLQIPEYEWWNEGLHGVARAGIATVFPQAIGLAAMWNTDLMYQIADIISTEARAKHHEFLRNNERGRYKGLTIWSPNINIFRDPRWGRGQETYGEDPFLTARLGVEFVKGLQGNNPKYFKTIATPKHYAVHSGPEPERHTFDAITDLYDLHNTYLPAFEACIKEANAYSVMCAYNRYMGDACCSSDLLLKNILRNNWGFDGYIVSDCGAIADIFENHNIVETAPEAAAIAVRSGTDLNCGQVYDDALIEAVEEGLITEEEIDISVRRLFTARFKLGMFDPPDMVEYAQIPYSVNDSEEHRKLSLKAAQESIVLLKNENDLLPLKKDIKKIAVIGPTADSYEMLLGNYNGTPSKFVTPLQGIKNKAGKDIEIYFEQGCNLVGEGAINNFLKSDLLSTSIDGKELGLKVEYFKNKNLEGEPFHTGIDKININNWLWSETSPEFDWRSDFSIRYSGNLKAPETGKFNFIVKGKDGYRLYIDDKLIIEDWAEHDVTTKSNFINLEKGKSYSFKLEFFKSKGWPLLQVQWELLNTDPFEDALNIAKNSDVIIFVGGITAQLEGEEMHVDYEGFRGGDRTSINLPKVQEDLIKLLHSTGKPVVVVLTSGSALAVNWEKDNIPAMLHLWYPGQEGGTALADVLFGDYNPAGRLPVTFYKSVDQLPPFEDYNMEGKTYRYFKDEPLYPFGYGLSFTKFKYDNLIISDKIKAGENVKISVEVTNSGKIAGDEVVQLYLKDVEASVPIPIHSLQGFKRVYLNPGEKKLVEFELQPKQFAVIKPEGNEIKKVIEPGSFQVSVGGLLPGTKSATTEYVTQEIKINGEEFIVE